MVFNPLFLQVINNQETPAVNKTQKMTGPSYLFSDIIKVCLDKSETGASAASNEASSENNLLSNLVSALSGQTAKSPVEELLNAGQFTLGGTTLQSKSFNIATMAGAPEEESLQEEDPSDVNSLLVGNSELFNFINDLISNQQFDGKISVVNTVTDESGNTVSYEKINNVSSSQDMTAGGLLDLLKQGNTIAVENSAAQSSNGLLITLVQMPGSGKLQNADAASALLTGNQLSSMSANNAVEKAGLAEPLYKLNFSLVENQETAEPVLEKQGPIIKFPFSSALNEAGNLPGNNLSAASSSADAFTGQISSENTAASSVNNNQPAQSGENVSGQNDALLNENTLQSGAPSEAEAKIQEKPAENIELTGKTVLLKDEASKDSAAKMSKFARIERIKTDSGVQAKAAAEPEMQKQEFQTSEQVDSERVNARQVNSEQDVSKNLEETGSKKAAAENHSVKMSSSTPQNQKEQELNQAQGTEKQESQAAAADKTEIKNTEKSETNNSGKEQNHQSKDNAPASEHQEVKVKTQDEHSFNIGNVSKTHDTTVHVKQPAENGLFGEAAKTVKAAEVMNEISKFIRQGDKNSIVLKIDPENLGTVKIALDITDKLVHANIEVENESARKLMENNLNQLYNSLNQSGVQLNSINISLANQEQKQAKAQHSKRKPFNIEIDKDSDDTSTMRQKQMGYNTYDYLV